MSEEERPPHMGVMVMDVTSLERSLFFPPDCSIAGISFDAREQRVTFLLSSPVFPPRIAGGRIPFASMRYSVSWPTPEHLSEHPETVTAYRKITSELQVL